MKRLVLGELDDPVVVDVSADVATDLAAFELVDVEPASGGFRLAPRGRVGAVRVRDFQVEVAPKARVTIASVLFLLGYAATPGFIPPDVDLGRDDDLFAAIAEALVRQSERALAGGVLQGYVSVDETARTVRGRIRMSDQVLRHYGGVYPVEITYDDFNPDIVENRILLSALRRVAELPRLSRDTGARIEVLVAALDGVRVIPRGQRVPGWVPSRLNERYHTAMHLADLVLRHQSLRPSSDGGYEAAGFVVDMAKVFEDFVSAALKDALKTMPGVVRTQYPTTLDEPQVGVSRVVMYPDVVHEVRGDPVAVADAKYKASSRSGDYPNADKYQMLAYCTALGLDRGWLVYAQGGEPVVRRIANTDIDVIEWPLDLSRAPRAILSQVDELAEAMRAGAVRTTSHGERNWA